MTTQDTDVDGSLYFIAELHSDKVQALQADPRVDVSYSDRGSWVSIVGTVSVVDDEARLGELWSAFTGSWWHGGPENPDPENILIEVDAESAECWDAPGGSKVVQLTNLVKVQVTGSRVEGDDPTVEM